MSPKFSSNESCDNGIRKLSPWSFQCLLAATQVECKLSKRWCVREALMQGSQPTLITFPQERPVFLRERLPVADADAGGLS